MQFKNIFFLIQGETCTVEEPLLNGANPVPDSYFTASSDYSASYAAPCARLYGTSSWWTPTVDESIPVTFFLQVSIYNIFAIEFDAEFEKKMSLTIQ